MFSNFVMVHVRDAQVHVIPVATVEASDKSSSEASDRYSFVASTMYCAEVSPSVMATVYEVMVSPPSSDGSAH